MKYKLAIILLVCCVLVGCSDMKQPVAETNTYVIPNSFFEFTHVEVADEVSSCLALGRDYCTDAREVPEGMELVLTAEQLNNFVQRNNTFVDELVEKFLKADSLYRCELDGEYQTLSLYFDENISTGLQVETMLGIASHYGINYMLTNDTTEWNVFLSIYNCHTNKLVVSVNIPEEKVSYGAQEWEDSYIE